LGKALPQKLRKTRKKRGSRTCGFGQIGQHRKSGTKGGRRTGLHKHGWTYMIKYEPEYFGKKGFTSQKALKRKINAINVGELDGLTDRLAVENKLEKKREKVILDLDNLGYNKLLGMGKTTKPMLIKVSSYSKAAAEKIKESGGQILEEQK
jgi:large subunit ribosomal protein L15